MSNTHEETAKRLDLPNGYWLEKQDGNCWWLGCGRLNLALKIVPNVPCGPGGSIDSEVEKFASALAEKDAEIERLKADLAEVEKELARVQCLPEQEWAEVAAIIMQILASAARAGFSVKDTDAVAAFDRGQTYVTRLRAERDAAEAKGKVEGLERAKEIIRNCHARYNEDVDPRGVFAQAMDAEISKLEKKWEGKIYGNRQ